jgi:dTDP-4-amino-4,6-dideoxygalactose transaminase
MTSPLRSKAVTNIKVPFLDLSVTNDEKRNLLNAIERVLDHGIFIQGAEHQIFEKQVAQYAGRKHAISVGSGTDALYLTFKCLGIKEGDEIITTPLSWIASVNAFALLGAIPVFVDIGTDLNIDPNKIEPAITANTKAILAVDYAGLPCHYDELERISNKHNIMLIEDGSQAFGATYHDKKVGTFGIASCVSLNPMKSLAACGEAGVIFTDNDELAEKLTIARYNGMVDKTHCYEPGINGRMDTLQAAILLEKLKTFEQKILKRKDNAAFYDAKLNGVVKTPVYNEHCHHAYFLYLIEHPRRDELYQFLENHGVEARIRDNILINEQPAYINAPHDGLNLAKNLVSKKLAIPVSEKITRVQQEYVCNLIEQFCNNEQ